MSEERADYTAAMRNRPEAWGTSNTKCEGPIHLGGHVYIADSTLGRYVGVSPYTRITRATIGSFCCIGHRVSINPFQHPISWLSTHGFQFTGRAFHGDDEYAQFERLPYESVKQRQITIGNDVWIGDNAAVMANVGDGAVVGAGAVVTHDVPPYAIVGGVPAKILYFRFSDMQIARLLRVKWWDRPLRELSGLPFNDIDTCLDILEGRLSNAA